MKATSEEQSSLHRRCTFSTPFNKSGAYCMSAFKINAASDLPARPHSSPRFGGTIGRSAASWPTGWWIMSIVDYLKLDATISDTP